MSTKKIKEQLTKPEDTEIFRPSRKNLLGTGSTLLNLACSGKPYGGWPKGKYIFLVGDSTSGKTWLSLTCFAEAAGHQAFKDYRFIYDNGEDGALMDMERYFGKRAASRIEPPATDKEGEAIHSETVEDFYFHLDDALADNRPFIYVLDSQDALDSKYAQKKFKERKKAKAKSEEAAGSYGDGKAKYHSEHLRRVVSKLRETGSILVIVSQTRDNLGMGFETKTRSGGKSLRFYATLECWSSVRKKIKKAVNGHPRQIGIQVLVKTKKNRLTGREVEVEFPIYFSHGIDDIGGCIDFLVSEKHWTESNGSLTASEFNFKGKRSRLIREIEEGDKEIQLRQLVGDVWAGIESKLQLQRKPRYE